MQCSSVREARAVLAVYNERIRAAEHTFDSVRRILFICTLQLITFNIDRE